VREILGGLLATVAVEPPPMEEQLHILHCCFPGLEALLPGAAATLNLVRRATTQAQQATTPAEDRSTGCGGTDLGPGNPGALHFAGFVDRQL
jgi:hypothetical protein